MKTVGVVIGRFCPLHKGHMRLIEYTIEKYGLENSLVLIGSCNSNITLRTLFTYDDRRRWLKYYPGLKICGIPDYEYDHTWNNALKDYIESIFEDCYINIVSGNSQYYDQYENIGFGLDVLNRNSFICSGTDIRRKLYCNEDIRDLIHEDLITDIKQTFVNRIMSLE